MGENIGHSPGGNQESLPSRYFQFVQCQLLAKGGTGHEGVERTNMNPTAGNAAGNDIIVSALAQ